MTARWWFEYLLCTTHLCLNINKIGGSIVMKVILGLCFTDISEFFRFLPIHAFSICNK